MREPHDQRLPLGTPIPVDSPDSTFRVGLPFEDPHENVVYRVVSNLNVAEGWGTAAFWTKRWGCNYADILQFAQMGWLDAAISAGSSVKRYRCRDEMRCLDFLAQREELREIERKREEEKAVAAPPPTTKFSKGPKAPKRFGRWGKK